MRLRVLTSVFLATATLAAEPLAKERDVLREVQQAELAIDNRFKGVADPNPMAMVGYTRGGYIEGFGAVFTLEVNLAPTADLSPFRQAYSDEEKQQLNLRKRQRLEDLEARVREILVQEGSRLETVPLDEKVALIVSLFHFRWEDVTHLPSQMVVQATRRALIEGQSGTLSQQEYEENLAMTYF